MKKTSKPILFFGSGPVAAESLQLLAQIFSIEAVITKPRAEHHKGDVPVLSVAEELGLPVHTVTNKRSLDELIDAQPFQSSVAILIDFGIIVSQKVIDTFPLGIVNSHFSLLPEWRGADPITFAVLSGQKETGVSLMLLVQAMDEGPLLGYGTYELDSDITTPELTNDLVELSYALLCEIMPGYIAGAITPQPQSTLIPPTYSHKLIKEDGIIDWQKPATQIEREIRAYLGWPGSKTRIAGKDVIVTRTHVLDESGSAGQMVARGKELIVYCGESALVIERLKPAGKQEMAAEAFLAGHKHLL